MKQLRTLFRRVVCCLAAWLVGLSASCPAAEDPQIEAAIRRGVQFLKSQLPTAAPGHAGLAVYACLKAGESADSPEIAGVLAGIQAKIQRDGEYRPRQHHVYEAAVDLMALEAADPELYRPSIEAMARYLLAQQKEGGYWYYPDRQDTGGDTSITQYGVLGLWAASRAGIEVPPQVWDRAAGWHLKTQGTDGGFVYHPGEIRSPRDRNQTHSMTAAGAGSLSVARLMLTTLAQRPPPSAGEKPPAKYGVLEPLDLAPPKPPTSDYKPVVPRGQIDQAVTQAHNWIAQRYGAVPKQPWFHYYLYGLERMAALGDLKEIAGRDWYADGSAILLKSQNADGSWTGGQEGISATSFALLFLTRATRTLITPRRPPEYIGNGLLVGGRGLPEDLSKVDVENGDVRTRKIDSPIEALLSELERPNERTLETVQESLVETVQLDRPEELIGQKERLIRLVRDPRVEVRRTALWALGRTGDLRLVPQMIEALSDPDLSVGIEARNALCVLSRKPDGLGLPDDPRAGLPEDATDERRRAAEEEWKKSAQQRWRQWYERVRPYDERDVP